MTQDPYTSSFESMSYIISINFSENIKEMENAKVSSYFLIISICINYNINAILNGAFVNGQGYFRKDQFA